MLSAAGALAHGFVRVTGAFARPRRLVRDLVGMPETLARAGSLELKFAVTKGEIRRAQRLRYRVFFEQGGAIPDAMSRARRRDICPFDRVCDHIIVIDHAAVNRFGRRKPKVVGAYRVLRQERIGDASAFYSSAEFDVPALVANHPGKRFLELGRSCVLPEYRARRVLELLWRGLLAYARHHRIDCMIGCASLPGADPLRHVGALAFLRQHARAQDEWSVRVREGVSGYTPPPDLVVSDPRRAIASLPPLLKGYLRLGARFGDGAFVDHAFGATDVFVVMPVKDIDPRYIEHFSGGLLEPRAA
jgi:putative hemolysin